MEWCFQNERDDWPRRNNDFETACLHGFATPGSDHTVKATTESGMNPHKNGDNDAWSVAPQALLWRAPVKV